MADSCHCSRPPLAGESRIANGGGCDSEGIFRHADWCCENIPLKGRAASYAHAMFAIGHSPATVFTLISPEDRAALSSASSMEGYSA